MSFRLAEEQMPPSDRYLRHRTHRSFATQEQTNLSWLFLREQARKRKRGEQWDQQYKALMHV